MAATARAALRSELKPQAPLAHNVVIGESSDRVSVSLTQERETLGGSRGGGQIVVHTVVGIRGSPRKRFRSGDVKAAAQAPVERKALPHDRTRT